MSTPFTAEQQAERQGVALLASYEIESTAMHMANNLPTEPEYLYLRSMVLRVIDLSRVVMSVAGCEVESSTEEMRRIVEGLQ